MTGVAGTSGSVGHIGEVNIGCGNEARLLGNHHFREQEQRGEEFQHKSFQSIVLMAV